MPQVFVFTGEIDNQGFELVWLISRGSSGV